MQLNIRVGLTTINRCIKSFHYTFKRIHTIPHRRNDPDVIKLRKLYAEIYLKLVSEIDDAKIFFIDEVGFNVSMRLKSGRSLRGTTPIHLVPNIRSRNISVCAAINKDGIVKYSAETRAYNSATFKDFIISLIEQLNQQGCMDGIFIMDNVPFNKVHDIQLCAEQRNFKIQFLPPYSRFSIQLRIYLVNGSKQLEQLIIKMKMI
ncbi:hypothetical protein ENBRE01_2355 [Enteropsectra breve]|nr:hypothetical protein ENBRE01_2355 [Enteropsectra breve]